MAGSNGNGRGPGLDGSAALAAAWRREERWSGIVRDYTPDDVVRLRGSVQVEHTLARRGAEQLWELLHD
jgi:isocitrate lyase